MNWLRRRWVRLRAWWTQPGPRKWRGVAMVVPFFILLLVSVGYTNYESRQADQRWCELIVFLDDQYQSVPPDSEVAEQFAQALHRLRLQLDC